jgi:hypothetical protein
VFLSHKSLHVATASRSAQPSKLLEDQETEDTTFLHSYIAHKTKWYLHHKSILSEHIFIIYLHELKPQQYPSRSLSFSVEITSPVLVQRCSVKNRAIAASDELSCQMCAVMHREETPTIHREYFS